MHTCREGPGRDGHSSRLDADWLCRGLLPAAELQYLTSVQLFTRRIAWRAGGGGGWARGHVHESARVVYEMHASQARETARHGYHHIFTASLTVYPAVAAARPHCRRRNSCRFGRQPKQRHHPPTPDAKSPLLLTCSVCCRSMSACLSCCASPWPPPPRPP